jgi:hypothetical protein
MEVGDESTGAKSPPSKTANQSTSGLQKSSSNASNAAAARNLLCVKRTGEYFGEGIFAEGKVHDLNVVTSGDVQLLQLTKGAFGKYITKFPEMPDTIRSIAMSMEKQLQQLEFFKGIDASKMKMLSTMFNFVPLLGGAILFKENDFDREAGNSLYFLYKGKVKVVNAEKKDGECVDKTLNTLEPGCFFGTCRQRARSALLDDGAVCSCIACLCVVTVVR